MHASCIPGHPALKPRSLSTHHMHAEQAGCFLGGPSRMLLVHTSVLQWLSFPCTVKSPQCCHVKPAMQTCTQCKHPPQKNIGHRAWLCTLAHAKVCTGAPSLRAPHGYKESTHNCLQWWGSTGAPAALRLPFVAQAKRRACSTPLHLLHSACLLWHKPSGVLQARRLACATKDKRSAAGAVAEPLHWRQLCTCSLSIRARS